MANTSKREDYKKPAPRNMTPAQRRRARHKANKASKRCEAEIQQNIEETTAEVEQFNKAYDHQQEAGTQMAMSAAQRLKSKFARKKNKGNGTNS